MPCQILMPQLLHKEEVEKKKKEMEVESAKLKVVQEEQDHQSVCQCGSCHSSSLNLFE